MPKLAGVGNNTVDKYVNQGMMYPGGNAVNVAVLARRYGLKTSYVGWIGNDIYGQLILNALKEENVDISYTHVKDDVTNYTEIYIKNGDRTFGNVRRGASSKFKMSNSDIQFLAEHDIIHTSYYSSIEPYLDTLSKLDSLISFDFTDEFTIDYLNKYVQSVDIGIFSISDKKIEDIKSFMEKLYSKGLKFVICTKGSSGSYLYDGQFYFQPIVETEIIDTLGAGDGFVARFLVEYIRESDVKEALHKAAISAADVCQYHGAFNRGIPVPSNKM
ncbi:MAG: fructoselysine 6-kinase [Candidatus Heimdallarchaeota archaeon]|nr:fructoselysine 6-kinase [Candidatus Heimdallarchaeota archaeon]